MALIRRFATGKSIPCYGFHLVLTMNYGCPFGGADPTDRCCATAGPIGLTPMLDWAPGDIARPVRAEVVRRDCPADPCDKAAISSAAHRLIRAG